MMAFKEKFKSVLCPYDAKTQKAKYAMGTIVSGGLAGTCSLLITYPLDFARTRLSTDVGSGKDR